jgi:hypothetical protein
MPPAGEDMEERTGCRYAANCQNRSQIDPHPSHTSNTLKQLTKDYTKGSTKQSQRRTTNKYY